MDKRGEILLEYLNGICGINEYKIINLSEITLFSPTLFSDEEIAKKTVKSLSDDDYVKVKYFDGEQYCISATLKGKSFFERERAIKKTVKRDKLYVFFASFSGSFLGGLLLFCIMLARGKLC